MFGAVKILRKANFSHLLPPSHSAPRVVLSILLNTITSSIFSFTLTRRKYAHTQNVLTFIIYIYCIFLQNSMLLGDCVQNLLPFWDERCTKNKSLLSRENMIVLGHGSLHLCSLHFAILEGACLGKF